MASEESLPLNLQQRERVDPHTGCKDVVPALVRKIFGFPSPARMIPSSLPLPAPILV